MVVTVLRPNQASIQQASMELELKLFAGRITHGILATATPDNKWVMPNTPSTIQGLAETIRKTCMMYDLDSNPRKRDFVITEVFKRLGRNLPQPYASHTRTKLRSEYTPTGKAVEQILQKVFEVAGVTKEQIEQGLLKEAEGFGPDTKTGARVTAWTTLAKIKGMLSEQVNVDNNVKITFTNNWRNLDKPPQLASDIKELSDGKS